MSQGEAFNHAALSQSRFLVVGDHSSMVRFALLAMLVVALSREVVAADDARRPNFVVLLADDMGFSDLGCYGSEIETPNLDALAHNGLRYTQFYNCARCTPTRAALLTGYYPQQIRLDDFPGKAKRKGPRESWAPLLPSLLRSYGYRSYHSGKWHLDGTPLKNGFDHSYQLGDFDRNFYPSSTMLDEAPLPAVSHDGKFYTTDAIADRATSFLEEHTEKHGNQPFFLYVAFQVPHFPLQAPAKDVTSYAGRYDKGWDAIRQSRWRSIQQYLHLPGELSELEPTIGPPYFYDGTEEAIGPDEVWREAPWRDLSEGQKAFQSAKMSVHAAMVHRMDHAIGRIVDQLHRTKSFDNTVIFFLSDNGASSELMVRGDGHDKAAPIGSAKSYLCLGPGWSSAANTPFRRHKSWVHEGGIATPLIVHWPHGIAAHGELRTQAVGHVVDFAPTIVELAGGTLSASPPAPDRPGASLANTFQRDEPIVHPVLWWLHEGNRAVRVGDWKLVASRGEPWELYNLEQDRAENHNLASAKPEKVRELETKWSETAQQFQNDRHESQLMKK